MDSRLIDSIILGNTDLAEMEFQDAMRDRVAAAFEVRKVELASGLLPSDELNEGMYDFSLDAYNGMPYEVWKMYKDYNVKQGGRIRIHTPDEMEWHGKTAVVRDVSDGLVHVQLDDTGRKLALTPNQLKPITMNEARIPLEGHPYHDKSDDQLRYIIKDASEAAKAMKEVNPAAEGKYLDQVNDASTVLNYRKRSAGRVVTEALSPETNAAYGEYEDEDKYRASGTCPRCKGKGRRVWYGIGRAVSTARSQPCYPCGGTGKYPNKDTQVSEAYSKDAVNKAIASSNRSGRKIGGKEAKAIHRLLSGRASPETPTKPPKVQKESMDKVGKEDKDIDNDGDHDKTDKYLHNRRKAIGRAIAKKKMNEAEQIDEFAPLAALALRAAPMLARAAPTIAGAAERKAVATAAEKGMGSTSQKIIGGLVRRGTSGAVKKTASAIERKASQSQQQNEMAPSGAKYERMVKHIKAKYAKGGLTDQERAIAYATAWKAKRAAEDE